MAHDDVVIFAAVFLLQVKQLVIEVQDVADKFLWFQTKSREVRIHHHSVCKLIDFNMSLNIIGVIYSFDISHCCIPTEFELKLLRKHNPICLVI